MLLGIVKERKVRLFGNVVRAKGTLVNTIFHYNEEGQQDNGWVM